VGNHVDEEEKKGAEGEGTLAKLRRCKVSPRISPFTRERSHLTLIQVETNSFSPPPGPRQQPQEREERKEKERIPCFLYICVLLKVLKQSCLVVYKFGCRSQSGRAPSNRTDEDSIVRD
jgi:hypothetical protein